MATVIPNVTNVSLTLGVSLITKNSFLPSSNFPRKRNKQLLPSQKYILPLSTSLRLFPQLRIGHNSQLNLRTCIACATGTDVTLEADLSASDNEASVSATSASELTGESSAKSSASATKVKRPGPVRKSEMPPVKNEELVPGATFTGKVRSIQPFGAFIDFGAFTDGLVHVSRLSSGFVKDVASIVTVGQEVTVRLVEANMDTGRISLSMRDSDDESRPQQRKDAQVNRDGPRPPRKNGQKFSQKEDAKKRSKFVKGQDLEGTVKNVTRAGAFISLPEGEEGFLPTSEEADEGFGNLMGDSSLEIGQEVSVRVLRFSRGQVTLTMKKEEATAELDSKLSQGGVIYTATNPFVLAFRSNKDISDFLDERKNEDGPSKNDEKDAKDTEEVSMIDDTLTKSLDEEEELAVIPDSSPEEALTSSAVLIDSGSQTSEDQITNEEETEISGNLLELAPLSENVEESSKKEIDDIIVEDVELSEKLDYEVPSTTQSESESLKEIIDQTLSEIEEVSENKIQDVMKEIDDIIVEDVELSEKLDYEVPSTTQSESESLKEIIDQTLSEIEEVSKNKIQDVMKKDESSNEKPEESIPFATQESQVIEEYKEMEEEAEISGKSTEETQEEAEISGKSTEEMEEEAEISGKSTEEMEEEAEISGKSTDCTSFSKNVEESSEKADDDVIVEDEQSQKLDNEVPSATQSESESLREITDQTLLPDILEEEVENKIDDAIANDEESNGKPEEAIPPITQESRLSGEAVDNLGGDNLVSEVQSQIPDNVEKDTEANSQTKGNFSNPTGQTDGFENETTVKATISPALVKQLREETGAGMMDCKKALSETGGDIVKAQEYLRKKGLASADKKASRATAEGRIGSYIHDNRIGVLIEVNCETDFVARGDIFKELVEDLAMQVAACPQVQYLSPDDVSKEIVDSERELEMQRDDLLSKPEQFRSKIVDGRIRKRLEELALLEQPFIKDDKVVVKDWVKQTISTIGENINVKRFVRYNLGEGLEKKSQDFAAEVAAQTTAKPVSKPVEQDPTVAAETTKTAEESPKTTVSAALVKQLREETGAGMMDCKKALSETGGDLEKAQEYLRKKGLSSADKKSSRLAAEGRIGAYIHDSRIGVLIEVNCETDFVGRGQNFKELVDDLAMQVVASPQVQYVSIEDIPETIVNEETQLEMQREDILSKPENIREKIVEGRVKKRLGELVLLDQPFIKNDSLLVKDLIKQTVAALGENIKVRRFIRFTLGETTSKNES